MIMGSIVKKSWLRRCNLCGWPLIPLPFPAKERCLACFSTPIHRAVGLTVQRLGLSPLSSLYELSSRGALVRYLKRHFPNLYLSELYDDVPPGESRQGIPCQDVQALRLSDELFDLVTSTEVFEHVPDDNLGFSEVCRVLRPGGYFVFTVPLGDFDTTIERAVLSSEGVISHLTDPEFHSDRIRGGRRVLAFRTYGRDIVHRLKIAGFDASIINVVDLNHDISGQAVIIATKVGRT